jgi:Na+/melibiose symporter-like transporter
VLLRVAGVMPPNGSSQLVSVLMLFVFLFYLATAILTISVLSALADVADEHELNTGRRQEGIFYAARTFFAKLSSGLGHIVAGLAIDLIEFPTGAKPGQVAEDIVMKLGLLDGPIAAVPSLLAIVFYGMYRIDRKRHAEIQHELAARRGSTPPGATAVAANPAAGPAEPAIVG